MAGQSVDCGVLPKFIEGLVQLLDLLVGLLEVALQALRQVTILSLDRSSSEAPS